MINKQHRFIEKIINGFFKNGPISASFCLLSSFSHHNFNNKNWKSTDGVLGIWTHGCRMVGADDTTELWRPPQFMFLSFKRSCLFHFQIQLWPRKAISWMISTFWTLWCSRSADQTALAIISSYRIFPVRCNAWLTSIREISTSGQIMNWQVGTSVKQVLESSLLLSSICPVKTRTRSGTNVFAGHEWM